jgi:phosphatidylserine decarboxylase
MTDTIPMSRTQRQGISSRLRLAAQYLLPHHLLTGLVRAAAHWQWRPWAQGLIRWFVRTYRVDMSEAVTSEPSHYPDFNAFFTRALRPGAREWHKDQDAICSPVDGIVSRTGHLEDGRVIQAKGMDYGLSELMGDEALAGRFRDGAYATLYLSPSHYHRVHVPLDAKLRSTRYIPGRLYSVAPFTVQGVPRLFCRNERLVCVFDTPLGAMAQILVGAMLVAGIETVWHGRYGHPRREQYETFEPEQVVLARGEEMGRFNMGSTVILAFERERVVWRDGLVPGDPVYLGQRLGNTAGRRATAAFEDK